MRAVVARTERRAHEETEMPDNVLQHGVDVYSCDGDKLGKVKHFFSAAEHPKDSENAPAGSDVYLSETPAEALEQQESQVEVASVRVSEATDSAGTPFLHASEPSSGEAPRMSPGMHVAASATKYVEVHHGGLLHPHHMSLYVPLDAINVIENDGSVVLRCTRAEAVARYSQKPPPLDDSVPGSPA
jgi:hypothetical protein